MNNISSIYKLISKYFSGKTLISINSETITQSIINTIISEHNRNLLQYHVSFTLLDDQNNVHYKEGIISLDKNDETCDNVIISPNIDFITTCKFNKKNDFGDNIVKDEFRECVECGMFIDSDGHGYAMLNNDNVLQCSFSVQELYELTYHPDVKSILWYNK